MRKFYKLFAAMMLVGLSFSARALEPVDGVYKIGTAAELKEFAELVNGGQTDINAELTADIDFTAEFTHIGYVDEGGNNVAYTGTFDGKGHTVTFNVESDDLGGCSLFHVFSGTIQNLKTAGSIVSTAQYAASIAYRMEVGAQLINCQSSMTITAKDFFEDAPVSYHGGLIGYQVGSGLMQGCAFTGRFAGAVANRRGGLIGWCGEGNGVLTLKSCLMIASLDDDLDLTDSDNFFTHNVNAGNKQTLVNCLYLNDMGHTLTTVDGIQIKQEALASGEACYVLNGRTSEDPIWYQTLPGDVLPTTDSTHGVVYANGHQHCNGDDYEGGTTYSNTNSGIQKDDHDFVNGICGYCHTANPDYLTLTEDGYYELTSAGDMVWFASLVNSGIKSDANGRVMNPIDMAGVDWTPIGSRANNYTGNFDGQLMPITNLNGMYFGTTGASHINGLAFESGEASCPSEDIALHTGSLVGFANGETILTNSYSKAHVIPTRGDKGAISGKFWGTMDHVYFAGTFESGVSGLISSSNEGVRPAHLKNCYVNTTSVTSGWSGAFVAWQHSGSSVENCWVVADAFGTKYFEHSEGSNSNYGNFTADEALDGSLCYKLNGNSFQNATWFQSLSDGEEMPCLDKTHGLVYPYKGEFKSAGEDFSQMRTDLLDECAEYTDNVIAYQVAIDAYVDALEATKSLDDRDDFVNAYYASKELLAVVQASEKVYKAYIDAVEAVKAAVKEDNLTGEVAELIMSYIESNDEPGSSFVNGSYLYILENRQLDDEQIIAETAFIKKLLEDAILFNSKPGDEITKLIVNANLAEKPNFNGWTYEKSGSTFTVGDPTREVFPAAESWNATFDMSQTLNNLKDGLYELRANAAFRFNNDDHYNSNYAASLYANDNAVHVMMLTEDALPVDAAVDGENSYLTDEVYGGLIDKTVEVGDDECYVPAGPQGCSFAFKGGRYVNSIVALVSNGQLTVGLRNVGTGHANNWCGFGNFRLFYRGELSGDEASASLDNVLAGIAARATTLINYEPDASEADVAHPSYAKTLRDALTAAVAEVATAGTGEQKYALVQKFSQLFQQVYDSKQVYTQLLKDLNTYHELFEGLAILYPDAEDLANDYFKQEMEFFDKWVEGLYTEEEAKNLDFIKNTSIYKYMQENFRPTDKDGYYLLESVEDLAWFADVVNNVLPNAKARLTAPVDFGETENTPIGTSEKPFTGKFDGQLFPIKGLQHPFFGIINNATVEGLAIEECEIHGITEGYSEHTGAIACEATSSTVQRSYTKARVTKSGNDTGGMFGKIHTNMIIRNCLFAGSVSTGWSAACVAGSTNSSTSIADLAYCFIDARNMERNNGDGHGLLVGWEHGVPAGSIHDIYIIASPTLTNFFGHQETARIDNVERKTAEEVATGEVAWLLNEAQGKTVWYQTLGEDETPVLDNTRLVVIKDEDGNYKNDANQVIDLSEVEDKVASVVNIYDMNGLLIRRGVKVATCLEGLPRGMYIVGGKKALVK